MTLKLSSNCSVVPSSEFNVGVSPTYSGSPTSASALEKHK